MMPNYHRCLSHSRLHLILIDIAHRNPADDVNDMRLLNSSRFRVSQYRINAKNPKTIVHRMRKCNEIMLSSVALKSQLLKPIIATLYIYIILEHRAYPNANADTNLQSGAFSAKLNYYYF